MSRDQPRYSTRWALRLGVLIGCFASVSYSWTYSAQGRLDYVAAISSRVSGWAHPGENVSFREAADLPLPARFLGPDLDASLGAGVVPEFGAKGGVREEERSIEAAGGRSLSFRFSRPDRETRPPFYLHFPSRGDWSFGSGAFAPSDLVAGAASEFADRSDSVVIVPTFEDPTGQGYSYPASLDDAYALLNWISLHGASIGGDPSRIAVGGMNLGANIAAALTLRARDDNGPVIVFQYLLMPVTDMSGTREWSAFETLGDRYVMRSSWLPKAFEIYLPDRKGRISPLVSPLLAESLEGLPPALIVSAAFDPLRDQATAYARRLEDSGVEVLHHIEAGAVHAFVGSPTRAVRVQEMASERMRSKLSSVDKRDREDRNSTELEPSLREGADVLR